MFILGPSSSDSAGVHDDHYILIRRFAVFFPNPPSSWSLHGICHVFLATSIFVDDIERRAGLARKACSAVILVGAGGQLVCPYYARGLHAGRNNQLPGFVSRAARHRDVGRHRAGAVLPSAHKKTSRAAASNNRRPLTIKRNTEHRLNTPMDNNQPAETAKPASKTGYPRLQLLGRAPSRPNGRRSGEVNCPGSPAREDAPAGAPKLGHQRSDRETDLEDAGAGLCPWHSSAERGGRNRAARE